MQLIMGYDQVPYLFNGYFLTQIFCFSIEINDNNTLCIIEYNFCHTNTIELKMSAETVNVCVNFL